MFVMIGMMLFCDVMVGLGLVFYNSTSVAHPTMFTCPRPHRLTVCLSVCLCLSVFLSVCLFLSVCMTVCLSVLPSLCLSVCLSVSVCMYDHLSV